MIIDLVFTVERMISLQPFTKYNNKYIFFLLDYIGINRSYYSNLYLDNKQLLMNISRKHRTADTHQYTSNNIQTVYIITN